MSCIFRERERRRKMKNISTKTAVTTSVLSAIVVLMGYTPLGLIPLPTMTATILHIPVAVGAILYGPKIGLILGTVMGLTSLSKAFLAPVSIFDPLFMNPFISVLPRALMGLITGYTFIGLRKVIKKSSLNIGITAAVASVANTVLTLGALGLIKSNVIQQALQKSQMPGTVATFLLGIVATSGVAETVITVVIVIPIVLALQKVVKS